MKFIKFQHTYKHDWETVTSAFWLKYPNPLQPHVKRVDTLTYDINLENENYHTWRLMSLNYNVPKWIGRILNSSGEGFGLEEINCSLKDKTLTLKSQNLTFQCIFRIEEICEYSVHPENPDWTLYTQQATYTVPSLGIASCALEKIAAQSALEKAQKGLNAMARKIGFLEDSKIKLNYDKLKTMASEQSGFYMTILDTHCHSSYEFINSELSDSIAYYHKMKRQLGYWRIMLKQIANEATITAHENYDQALKSYNDSKRKLAHKFDSIALKGSQKFFSFIDRDNKGICFSIESNFLNSIQGFSIFAFFRNYLLKVHDDTSNISRESEKLKLTHLPDSTSDFIQSCSSTYKTIFKNYRNETRHDFHIQLPLKSSTLLFGFNIPTQSYLQTNNNHHESFLSSFKMLSLSNYIRNLKIFASSTQLAPSKSNPNNNLIVLSSIGSDRHKHEKF